MRRPRVAVAAAVVGVVGFAAAATAGDHSGNFKTGMTGYEEVPAVSTTGDGQVDVKVAKDGQSLEFVLHYRGIESTVTQSHIHFGQENVNGGIVIFFCSNLGNGPAGTPPCPQPPPGEFATVEGTRTAADMVNLAAGQGIAAGEFDELVRALRAGVAYANVHSQLRAGGEIRGQFGDGQGSSSN